MARKSSLTGWLGVAAALGLAGYAGARYLRQRAAQHRRQPRTAVDWNRARWIATRVAADGTAPLRDRARHHAAYASMVGRSELLVAEYMGVRLPQPIEALAIVDRAGWIDANLQTFGGVIASLEALHGADGGGALDALLFEVNRQAVAAQLGGTPPREGWLHEDFLKASEATLIDEALARTGGNRTAAAKLLGLDRSTLRGKLPRG